MWKFKKKQNYYQQLIKELISLLNENGVEAVNYFNSPGLLKYMIYYPFNHIFCFLTSTPLDFLLKEKEREFARILMKLSKVRKKRVNLLLDSPLEYEYLTPIPIGRKANHKYEEELICYRERLREFEQIRTEFSRKKQNLFMHPYAHIYEFVCNELDATKCNRCMGTGIIPSIIRKPGLMCFNCSGSGINTYKPNITKEQLRQFQKFNLLLKENVEPTFTCFPVKYKSVYIRVIHGGQFFLVEK